MAIDDRAGAGHDGDLDVLIGEIRREAARRRAAPDFPVDEEARLAGAMDRLGPTGPGVDLAAVIAALDALARSPDRGGARRRTRRARRTGMDELAELVSSALRGLAARTADLEQRVGRMVAVAATSPAPVAGPGGVEPAPLEHWMDRTSDLLSVLPAGSGRPGTGRVLVAGSGAEAWVDRLAAGGADAYGVDPALEPFADTAAVRAGDPGEHLDRVAAGSLAAAVLVEPAGVHRAAGSLEHLAASLAAAAPASVVVVSEAPWWWRLRVPPPACDMDPDRPLVAESWIAVLDAAGFRASAEYGAGGRDYLVAATAGPAAGAPPPAAAAPPPAAGPPPPPAAGAERPSP